MGEQQEVVQNEQEDAETRFLNPFSLFNVVHFPNSECTTSLGAAGTCFTAAQCRAKQGLASGSCGSGFGVCCSFASECNTETSENGTYFTNPMSLSSVCSLMIRPMSDKICQVRLDLESFTLVDPDETGNCRTDYMQVTGGVANSRKMPTLCGTNTGQHLIYTAIPNFPARLSIVVDTQVTGTPREWRIRITQYECSSPSAAPEGCLQYFTGISGQVSSFNWKNEDNTNDPNYSNHLANLDYAACVRRESGYCEVEWTTATPYDQQVGFLSLSENLPKVSGGGTATLTATNILIGDNDCRGDYLVIPRGWGGTSLNNKAFGKDRYCGQALGYCAADSCDKTSSGRALGGVRSGVTPFTLGVVTDRDEAARSGGGGGAAANADSMNRGFRLNYRQHPCS